MRSILWKLLIVLLLVNTHSFCQNSFLKSYSTTANTEFSSITEIFGSGYLLAGKTAGNTAGGDDHYLLQTDGDGHPTQGIILGTGGSDQLSKIISTTDGGFLAVGNSSGYGTSIDLVIIKLNNDLSIAWSIHTGSSTDNEFCTSVVEVSGGNFIVTGNQSNVSTGRNQLFLLKCSSSGSILWDREYGGPCDVTAEEVILTSDHNIAVLGSSNCSGAGNTDGLLLKTDSLGNRIWSNTYGTLGNEGTFRGCRSDDGGFILCSSANFFTIKTDSIGQIAWCKMIASTNAMNVVGTLDMGGSYILATLQGTTVMTPTIDLQLFKIDPAGNLLSERTIDNGINQYHWGEQIIRGTDNSLIACGSLQDLSSSQTNGEMVKTDTSMNNCAAYAGLPYVDSLYSVSVDSAVLTTMTSGWVEQPASLILHSGATESIACFQTGVVEIAPLPLTVYPNPSMGRYLVEQIHRGDNLEILDSKGMSVEQKRSTGDRMEIDLSSTSNGIYFLKLTTATGKYTSTILIKN